MSTPAWWHILDSQVFSSQRSPRTERSTATSLQVFMCAWGLRIQCKIGGIKDSWSEREGTEGDACIQHSLWTLKDSMLQPQAFDKTRLEFFHFHFQTMNLSILLVFQVELYCGVRCYILMKIKGGNRLLKGILGLEDGLSVWNACCSWGEPGFASQHPCDTNTYLQPKHLHHKTNKYLQNEKHFILESSHTSMDL